MGLIKTGHAFRLTKLAESGYGSAGSRVKPALDAADAADVDLPAGSGFSHVRRTIQLQLSLIHRHWILLVC